MLCSLGGMLLHGQGHEERQEHADLGVNPAERGLKQR
jgi:hypothetical protein